MDTSDSDSAAYETVELSFAVALSAVRVATWWILWAAAIGYGIYSRSSKSQGWRLYKIIVVAVTLSCLRFSVYMNYADQYNRGHDSYAETVFNIYIFFANLSSSFFLALLLLLASGYCITRHQLGPHITRVLLIPAVVFVTGTITDYIFYNISSSTNGTQQISEMSQLEGFVWFICSLVNLCALIMSWVQIFDILQMELQELEDQQKRMMEAKRVRQQAEQGLGPQPAEATHSSTSQRKSLLEHDQNASHLPEVDIEEGADLETFADRVGFELKRKLLRMFSMGVFAYLTATVCVLMLPVFINTSVQNTILVGQYLVHLGFMSALVWIFRPRNDNPYLMLGADPEDLEGIAGLDTELAVVQEDDGDDARARDRAQSAATAPSYPLKHMGASGADSDTHSPTADQLRSSGAGAGDDAAEGIPRAFSHLKIKTKVDELPQSSSAVDMKEFNKNFSLDDDDDAKDGKAS